MCLAVPAKILEINGDSARADCGGNVVECNLALIDDAQVGDYVLVHAGFAIQKYEEQEALEILELLREALDEAP